MLLVIKEMQIKTTMRYHFTSVRMPIIKKIWELSIDKDVEKWKPSYMPDGNVKWYSHYGKHFGGSSKSTELPYDPAILLPGLPKIIGKRDSKR